MITKEEREKDKAICEAASTDWREGAVEKWHLYCAATHPERMAHERVLMRANESFPYEADVKAAAHCRNRLPLYIADAEEMEKRIAKIKQWHKASTDSEHGDPDERAEEVLALVLKILRGEKWAI